MKPFRNLGPRHEIINYVNTTMLTRITGCSIPFESQTNTTHLDLVKMRIRRRRRYKWLLTTFFVLEKTPSCSKFPNSQSVITTEYSNNEDNLTTHGCASQDIPNRGPGPHRKRQIDMEVNDTRHQVIRTSFHVFLLEYVS